MRYVFAVLLAAEDGRLIELDETAVGQGLIDVSESMLALADETFGDRRVMLDSGTASPSQDRDYSLTVRFGSYFSRDRFRARANHAVRVSSDEFELFVRYRNDDHFELRASAESGRQLVKQFEEWRRSLDSPDPVEVLLAAAVERLLARLSRSLEERDSLLAALARALDDRDVAEARLEQLEAAYRLLYNEQYRTKSPDKAVLSNIAIAVATLVGPVIAALIAVSASSTHVECITDVHDAAADVVVHCGSDDTESDTP